MQIKMDFFVKNRINSIKFPFFRDNFSEKLAYIK